MPGSQMATSAAACVGFSDPVCETAVTADFEAAGLRARGGTDTATAGLATLILAQDGVVAGH
jgi:hypothetical protein